MFGKNRARRCFACLLAVTLLLLSAPSAFFAEAAVEMPFIDFESNNRQGFSGHAGSEVLTVTDEEARGGTKSLLVTNRSAAWHGPSRNVSAHIEPGLHYDVSIWVLPKTPESVTFRLCTQIGQGDGAQYYSLDEKTVSRAGGWTELTGTASYPNAEFVTIYIECDVPDAEFYIDDMLFYPPQGGGITPSLNLPSLKEIYAEHFLLGSAVVRSDLNGQRFELVKRHFNVMTLGNAMKPDALGGASKGEYIFDAADAMLQILSGAGFPVHGHTLVWHAQSADWLNQHPNGSVLTRAEARANLEDYITTVAGHYAGRVISWDVVNEAFTPSTGDGYWHDELRKNGTTNEDSPWYGAYENGADTSTGESGADYIYDAFVFARQADPNAILYYLDYNEEYAHKREVIALMTEELNEQWRTDPRNTEPNRLLIEGLGLQAHYWTNHLNPANVEETIIRWIQTGCELSIAELDIPMGSWTGYKELTEEEEQKQAKLYAELFQIFKKYSDHIVRVSIWGIDDPTSWRSGGSPLLFDESTSPKLAYYAVMDPEGYLAGAYDDVKSGGQASMTPISAPDKSSGGQTETPPPTGGDDEDADDKDSYMLVIIVSAAVMAAGVALVLYYNKRK
ncbi:MAG: endo-1,4-beta-xylanase [Oscillospiraceae bacterium]|nr:endo-1,4-beta-xylanase [Oscillospiraceae bacterium]